MSELYRKRLKEEFEKLEIFKGNGIALWERPSGEYSNRDTRRLFDVYVEAFKLKEVEIDQLKQDRQELIEVVKYYAKTLSTDFWPDEYDSLGEGYTFKGGKRAREVLKKMGVE